MNRITHTSQWNSLRLHGLGGGRGHEAKDCPSAPLCKTCGLPNHTTEECWNASKKCLRDEVTEVTTTDGWVRGRGSLMGEVCALIRSHENICQPDIPDWTGMLLVCTSPQEVDAFSHGCGDFLILCRAIPAIRTGTIQGRKASQRKGMLPNLAPYQ